MEQLARNTAALRQQGALSEAQELEVRRMELLFSPSSFAARPERVELLRALCRTFNVEFKPDVSPSHRRLVGPLIGLGKRALLPFLRALLGPSFLKQSEFNATVIKLLGELSNEQRQEP